MANKKNSKRKKKTSNDNMFSKEFGGMGDFGMNAGMGDPFNTGKKGKSNDMGFGMGDMDMMSIPTVEGDSGNPTNDFGGMGDFSEVGFDDAPQAHYDGSHIHPPDSLDMGFGVGGENMSNMFGSKKQKPIASNAKQYSHRGKKMVEDPENEGNLIPLATYKKRYGNSTQPKKQRRNQSGRQPDNYGMGDMGVAFGEMKQTGKLAVKVGKAVRQKLKNPEVDMMGVETQPDAPQNMKTPKQDAVRYEVIISFDDGSTTSFISQSLTEAKTAQKRYDAMPEVQSTQLTYL